MDFDDFQKALDGKDYEKASDFLKSFFQESPGHPEYLLQAIDYLKLAAFALPPKDSLLVQAFTQNDTTGGLIIYQHYKEALESCLANQFLKIFLPDADPNKAIERINPVARAHTQQPVGELRWLGWLAFCHDMQIAMQWALPRVIERMALIFRTVADRACDEIVAETVVANFHQFMNNSRIDTKKTVRDAKKKAVKEISERVKSTAGPKKGRGAFKSRVEFMGFVAAAILDCKDRGLTYDQIEQKDIVSFFDRVKPGLCKSVNMFQEWLKQFGLNWQELLTKYSDESFSRKDKKVKDFKT